MIGGGFYMRLWMIGIISFMLSYSLLSGTIAGHRAATVPVFDGSETASTLAEKGYTLVPLCESFTCYNPFNLSASKQIPFYYIQFDAWPIFGEPLYNKVYLVSVRDVKRWLRTSCGFPCLGDVVSDFRPVLAIEAAADDDFIVSIDAAWTSALVPDSMGGFSHEEYRPAGSYHIMTKDQVLTSLFKLTQVRE